MLRVALSRTYRRGHDNRRKKLGRSFSPVFFCGILSVSRMKEWKTPGVEIWGILRPERYCGDTSANMSMRGAWRDAQGYKGTDRQGYDI